MRLRSLGVRSNEGVGNFFLSLWCARARIIVIGILKQSLVSVEAGGDRLHAVRVAENKLEGLDRLESKALGRDVL